MVLQLRNISKSFGVTNILYNINITVDDRERVAIVGANGAGKSTLLKVITGEMSYDEGNIFISKDKKIGYLKQSDALKEGNTIWQEMIGIFSDVTKLEDEMRNLEKQIESENDESRLHKLSNEYAVLSEMFEKKDGFMIKTKINTVLTGMGFSGFSVDSKVDTLSGGEKVKLGIAKLLLSQPDVLILDEPTNHLDLRSMQWLEGYLKSYPGAVIVVTHDRYFLDNVVDTIYEIERCKATKYPGNYTKYLEQKKSDYDAQMKDYELQQKEIKRLEEYVAKNQVRASTAQSAKSKQKAIDRMELVERPDGALRQAKFRFETVYQSYKDVLKTNLEKIYVNDNGMLKTLVENVNFAISRGEKVGLVGDNGIGKSTLFKILLGLHENYKGDFEFGRNVEISYYDQEQKMLSGDKTVLNEIWDRFPRMDEVEVRTLLGSILFSDEDVFKKVSSLSGGEKARLAFLIIMLEKANTLFLDEPTNNLDLSAKEALDDAVSQYDGTVFFISHDRYFLNKIADKIFELTKSGVIEYTGNYDAYIEKKLSGSLSVETSANASEGKLTYEQEKRKNADIKNTTKKLEKCEEDIANVEGEIASLNAELENTGADFELSQKIYDEIQSKQNELDSLYEIWDELNTKLESIK